MPQKTLADTLAARETAYVNCGHPMCCKIDEARYPALSDRLGRDHGSMRNDLVGLLFAQIAGLPAVTAGRCSSHAFLTTKASSGRAIAAGSQLLNEGAESGRRQSLRAAVAATRYLNMDHLREHKKESLRALAA
ncbi:hypothetical protein [Mesorhizobium sp. M0199]|uniref:hypothetical protein n=1 Tax=Mesorhizobium sp. M0199 TaxID=2956911 RepID=UPI00333C2F17